MQKLLNMQLPKIAESIQCQLSDKGSMKFSIRNASDQESMEVIFHGAVGDDFEGLDSKSIAQTLSDNPTKDVLFRINSGGGLAFDGLAMYAAIARHKGQTTAEIEGLAASAAAVFPMACDNIEIHEAATMFVHHAQGIAMGNASAMRDVAKTLDTIDGQLGSIFAARSGQEKADVAKWLDGEENQDGTMFSAKEALKAGLADKVIPLKSKESEKSESKNVLKEGLKERLAAMGIG
jgi:ATP-dependent protease ClpP protease subunit